MTGFLGGTIEKADPTIRKMFEEMAKHAQAIVPLQQGITFQQIDGLLNLLNGKVIRGLWSLRATGLPRTPR